MYQQDAALLEYAIADFSVEALEFLKTLPLLISLLLSDFLCGLAQLLREFVFCHNFVLHYFGPILGEALGQFLSIRPVFHIKVLALSLPLDLVSSRCLRLQVRQCAPTAQQIVKVLCLLGCPLVHNIGNRLAQEKLTLLQLVVRADHNCYVHVVDKEIHDDDEEDKDDCGHCRISLVHRRIWELA